MTAEMLLDALANVDALRALEPHEQIAVLERLAVTDHDAAVNRMAMLAEASPADTNRILVTTSNPALRAQVWDERALPADEAHTALLAETDADVQATILFAYDISDEVAAELLPLTDDLADALMSALNANASYPTPVVGDLLRWRERSRRTPADRRQDWGKLARQVCRRPQTAVAVVSDVSWPAHVRLAACANDHVPTAAVLDVVEELARAPLTPLAREREEQAAYVLARYRLVLDDAVLVALQARSDVLDSRELRAQLSTRSLKHELRQAQTTAQVVETAGSPGELVELVKFIPPKQLREAVVIDALLGSSHLSMPVVREVVGKPGQASYLYLGRVARDNPQLLWEDPELAIGYLQGGRPETVLKALTWSGRAAEVTADLAAGRLRAPASFWTMEVPWEGDLDELVLAMPASVLVSAPSAAPLAAAAIRLLMSLTPQQYSALGVFVEDDHTTVGEALAAIAAAAQHG